MFRAVGFEFEPVGLWGHLVGWKGGPCKLLEEVV